MKERLDLLLVRKGFFPSRERARGEIRAGHVLVEGRTELRPGREYPEEISISLTGETLRYVSRGGLKLEKALDVFSIDPGGRVCLDCGASTGGFTDCMLQNGASKVYAVDVGYGQLAWKLRCDERVVNLERTNFRYVTKNEIPDEIDFASVDVSFISLKRIIPVMRELLKDSGEAVCLIKPQFEAGQEHLNKKGVVKDKKVHADVIDDICSFAFENGFSVIGTDYSPVKGPEGNIEYLMYIRKSDSPEFLCDKSGESLSEESHLALDRKE